MTDIKLSGGDIDTSGAQFSLVNGNDAIAQHTAIRLQFFQNEWFLDARIGMPYYESILVKNPDLSTISAIFQDAILNTPGISTIDNFDINFNSSERLLSVSFQATTDEDEILDFSEEFIII
jgi:hypothetical protein